MADSAGDSNCYEAAEGLYVGSLRSLGQLTTLGITHVVSAVNFAVSSELGGRPHHVVPLRDDPDESLLPHLPAALAFIQAAAESGGRVLVHCQAGRSRSVSVAVAYLMKARGLSAQAALDLVRAHDASAEPNEGFWGQLLLFQDMRCRLDESHPVYRLWALEQVGKQWEADGWVDSDAFASPPSDAQLRSRELAAPAYRCRKCRAPLCGQSNVLPVDVAIGHRMFKSMWRQRTVQADGGGGSHEGGAAAASLFVEPMAWMAGAVVGEVQGKLYCPGCNTRLGSFNWSGISNERGAWVTPGFQLHASKLDRVEPPAAIAALAQVRRPAFGTQSAAPAATMSAAEKQLTPEPAATMSAEKQLTPEPAASAAAPSPAGANPHGSVPPVAAAAAGTAAAGPPNGLAALSPLAAAAADALRPRLRALTHIVLDCDGVMVDSERASCEALRRAVLSVTSFDVPHAFPEDFKPVFGMDVRSCVEYYKAAHARTDWDVDAVAEQVLAAKEGIYKQLTSGGVRAFPGAAGLLAAAPVLGLGLGVASSGAPEKIRHNLETSGLWSLLEPRYVVSASHVPRGKPAPDVYLEAMRRLGCAGQPDAVLVVEDAINGLRAGRAAGALCIAVATSLPADALAPYADAVLGTIADVLPMLCAARERV